MSIRLIMSCDGLDCDNTIGAGNALWSDPEEYFLDAGWGFDYEKDRQYCHICKKKLEASGMEFED